MIIQPHFCYVVLWDELVSEPHAQGEPTGKVRQQQGLKRFRLMALIFWAP